MKKQDALSHRMLRAPLPSVILRAALPNTLGLLVISAYSLADSFFVSHLGEGPGAAVGICFSLQVFLQAIGYTFGMGGGALISHALGRGEVTQAARIARTALLSALTLGTLLLAIGGILRAPLVRFLGADGTTLADALAYVTPLLFSAPSTCATFVIGQLLRAEGKHVYAMSGLLLGSLLNILLDPLLIHTAALGIAGASVATAISQSAAALFLFSAYVFRKSRLPLFAKRERARRERNPLLFAVLHAGLPSLFRQGLLGLATLLTNRAALSVGDAAVVGLSSVVRVFLPVFGVCLGIAQGMMPVAGYCHGAGETERARAAYRFSLLASTLAMLLLTPPLFLLAPQILSFFCHTEEALAIGSFSLRAYAAVLFTHGVSSSTILYLQAIKKSTASTLLASARQGFCFLPLILLLPQHFGTVGLVLAQPAADALTFLYALLLMKKELHAPAKARFEINS